MSEKAACPKCDSYVSQVYYDGCHEWCGWNCRIEYVLNAYGPRGHMKFTKNDRPTPEERQHVADSVGCDVANVSVSVLVNGVNPVGWPRENEKLSPWLDPDKDPPLPISERKRKANLKTLRDRIIHNAEIEADRLT